MMQKVYLTNPSTFHNSRIQKVRRVLSYYDKKYL